MSIRNQSQVYVGLFVMLLWSPMYGQVPNDKVLYRLAVSESESLVVTQGPLLSVTALKRFLPAEVADRTTGCFALSVDLHSNGNPPLRLWSKLSWLSGAFQYGDLQILDLLVLPGRLVLITTEAKSTISVVQIGLYGEYPDRRIGLKPASWSLISAFVAPPGRQLTGKLKYNENQKRIDVEVTDHLQDTKQHTLFEQKGEEWDFIRAKQWQEKVPAANPGR